MINGLEVTNVAIYPIKVKPEGSYVEAYARIILNDSLIINGIKIVRGRRGLFVGFPQEFNKTEGRGFDICFPMSVALRDYISDRIISTYKGVLECSSN